MEIDFDYLEALAKKNAYLEILCELTEAKTDAIGKADYAGIEVAIDVVGKFLQKVEASLKNLKGGLTE